MLRKSVLWLSFASLVLIAAFTIGCGSSPKPTTTCTGGPYNVVGDWRITVATNSGSVTGYGAIDSAGLALFFDNTQPASSGDTLQLPTITGACAFTGTLTAYAEPGGLTSGQVSTDTVLGNVTSATAITGSLTGSPSGTITATSVSPLTGSVTAVTGSKNGVMILGSADAQVLLSLTFSQSGSSNSMSFSSTNLAGCEATGTFTQVGTSNVFDVSITLMPTCPITGTFTGLGFESDTDYFNLNGGSQDTYLYMDILDSASTFVMEIY